MNCFGNCFLRGRLKQTTNTFPAFTLNGVKTLAKVVDVYDGDTFKACMEHDGVMRKYTFRTLGYDAAEMRPLKSLPNREEHKELAVKARDLLREYILDKIITVECEKHDKYGRVLVHVYDREHRHVNQLMLDSGLVQTYEGGTRPAHGSLKIE